MARHESAIVGTFGPLLFSFSLAAWARGAHQILRLHDDALVMFKQFDCVLKKRIGAAAALIGGTGGFQQRIENAHEIEENGGAIIGKGDAVIVALPFAVFAVDVAAGFAALLPAFALGVIGPVVTGGVAIFVLTLTPKVVVSFDEQAGQISLGDNWSKLSLR